MVLLLAFLVISCTEKVEYLENSMPPRIVAYCLFAQDSLFKVHVSKTQEMYDTGSSIITDAKVEIYENGTLVENLQHDSLGIYSGNSLRAKANVEYELRVNAEGLPSVSAKDALPVPCEIVYSLPAVNNAGYNATDDSLCNIPGTLLGLNHSNRKKNRN